MDILEKCKKSFLESALDEFGKKYADFCNDHTCTTCPLAPAVISPLGRRQQCKACVIDHLTEANRKMDEAIAKAEEVKRKREEYAKKLLFAIKCEKHDLEYHACRDATHISLNRNDIDLLKASVDGCFTINISPEKGNYLTLWGMEVIVEPFLNRPLLKRGEFVIGFKTDSHIKEDGDE